MLTSWACITILVYFLPYFILTHKPIWILLIRSLKLGVVPGATTPGSCLPLTCTIRSAIGESNFSWNDKRSRQGRDSSVLILTRCCLSPLSGDGGAPGYVSHDYFWVICFEWALTFCFCRALLRKLHLYNIERMDNASLGGALSACPSLLDLEIVGL